MGLVLGNAVRFLALLLLLPLVACNHDSDRAGAPNWLNEAPEYAGFVFFMGGWTITFIAFVTI